MLGTTGLAPHAFIPVPGSIDEAGHSLNRIICLNLVNGRPTRRREAHSSTPARNRGPFAGDVST